MWQGIRDNDPLLLKQFYAQQFPTVRGFVTQNSGSEDDAKDVFQEAMIATWLNIKEGKFIQTESGSVGAYVNRIAKNKWLDRLRSSQFKNVKNAMTDLSDRISEISEEEKNSERIEQLNEIYSSLDEKCRKVLDMFYYEKKNLESIARELGYDTASLRTIKYRCMMKLRNHHLTNKIKGTL